MIRNSLFTWDGELNGLSEENKFIFENYLVKFSILLLTKTSGNGVPTEEAVQKAILDLTDSTEPQNFTYENRVLKLTLHHVGASVSKELFE